jgi:hypothetical protein
MLDSRIDLEAGPYKDVAFARSALSGFDASRRVSFRRL